MPKLWGSLLSLTRGVFPICSVTEFITTGGSFGLLIVDILKPSQSGAVLDLNRLMLYLCCVEPCIEGTAVARERRRCGGD